MSALTELFTNIANAIRTKKGTSAEIQASSFPTEIANLPTWEEYFEANYGGTDTSTPNGSYGFARAVKKIPPLTFPSNYTSMSYLFSNLGSVDNISLENFHTANVTNMSYCFSDCMKLTTINLQPIQITNKVTTMASAFYNCQSLETITWAGTMDTSNLSGMSALFSNCYSLPSVDLSVFSTAKVTSFTSLFVGCRSLETIDFGENFSGIKCTNIASAFTGCSALTTITGNIKDLGAGYTSSTTNYTNYKLDLSSCTSLTKASINNMINGLYDLATAGKPRQSLVLGSTNLSKLSSSEIAVATNKGWNVS